MDRWSDGVYLIGQYNSLKTGCWLLTNGKKGALLEMVPSGDWKISPAKDSQKAAEELGIEIKYLLCTHTHGDHFSRRTLSEMRKTFPGAEVHLQEAFKIVLASAPGIHYFGYTEKLDLDGEPLYLIHAPKHCWSDTMVVFRGTICTGDWELNTLRSVHDGKPDSVPIEVRLNSIDEMMHFEEDCNYKIHMTYSSHGNDCRRDVNFVELMEDTRVNRKLW